MKIEDLERGNISFRKVKSIGKGNGYIATSHVDLEKEKFSLNDLREINEGTKINPFANFDHNPSRPPVLRILNSKLERGEDSVWKVFAEFEFLENEDSDKVEELIKNGGGGLSPEFFEDVR